MKTMTNQLSYKLLGALALTAGLACSLSAQAKVKQLSILDQAPNTTADFPQFPTANSYFGRVQEYKGRLYRSEGGGQICTGSASGIGIFDVQGPRKNPELVRIGRLSIEPFDDPLEQQTDRPIALNLGSSGKDFVRYKGQDVAVVGTRICSPGWCNDAVCDVFIPGPSISGPDENGRRHGFVIYDVKDPSNPVVRLKAKDNFLTTTGGSPRTFKYKGKLYTVIVNSAPDRQFDFTLIDISDTSNPVLISGINLPDLNLEASGFYQTLIPEDFEHHVIHGRLYGRLATYDGGVVVVDWSDVDNPKLIQQTLLERNDLDVLTGEPGVIDAPNTSATFVYLSDNGRTTAVSSGFGNTRTFTTANPIGNVPGVEGGLSVPLSSFLNGRFEGILVVAEGDGVAGLSKACTNIEPDLPDPLPTKSDYPECDNQNCVLLIARGVCSFNEKAANITNQGWDGILIVSTDSPTSALVTTNVPWLMVDRQYGEDLVANNGKNPGDNFEAIIMGSVYQPFGQIRIMDSFNPYKPLRELAAIGIDETTDETIDLVEEGIGESEGFGGTIELITDELLYTSWGLRGVKVYDISSCNLKRHLNYQEGDCKPKLIAEFLDTAGPFEYRGETLGSVTGVAPIVHKGRTLTAVSGADTTLYLLDEVKKKKKKKHHH